MGFYNKYHSIVANCGGVAGILIFSGGPDGTLNIMGNHPLILDIPKFWYLGLGPYFGEKNDFFKGRKLNFPTPIRNMRIGINYQKIIKEKLKQIKGIQI